MLVTYPTAVSPKRARARPACLSELYSSEK
jgi:hypothetical protein